MNRRLFLKVFGSLAGLFGISKTITGTREPGPSLSVMQSITNETYTRFVCVHPKDIQLSFDVQSESGEYAAQPHLQKSFTRDHSRFIVTQAHFKLTLEAQKYILTLKDKDTQQILDQRYFKSLNSSKNLSTFAFCSCMLDLLHEPKIWNSLVRKKPDYAFFIGDNVYTDSRDPFGSYPTHPKMLWDRYVETRNRLQIFKSKNLIPILALWDDHDFGGNDNGQDYPYIKESTEIFHIFFDMNPSQEQPGFQRGPGVASTLRRPGQLFVFADNRSYRLEKKSTHPYAHFGKNQEDWLLKQMKAFQGQIYFVSGGQFFAKHRGRETFIQNHPTNLNLLLKKISQLSSRVIFISGDRHYSEVASVDHPALGYKTYEVTSSGMHSLTVPGLAYVFPRPGRIAATAVYNFCLFKRLNDHTNVQAINARGRSVFSVNLWTQIRG